MYCIPSFDLLVITKYGIIGTCIMHEVITVIIMIKYTILTTIPYLYRNTCFASNLQTYFLSCNFTQFLCYTSYVTYVTHNFFLSLSKVLVINNRIHHMALKGDLMIYTQCLYNAIQYVLTASHTPIHPPKLRYSPSLNQKNHQFPIVHAFFLSLENPSQVQKKPTYLIIRK